VLVEADPVPVEAEHVAQLGGDDMCDDGLEAFDLSLW
jgi:hypothetical protein